MKHLRTVQVVDKSQMRPRVARAFEAMGIHCEPIGAEKVQERLAAHGVKPAENAFSQEIIGIREE